MRTLGSMPAHKQRKIAEETLQVGLTPNPSAFGQAPSPLSVDVPKQTNAEFLGGKGARDFAIDGGVAGSCN